MEMLGRDALAVLDAAKVEKTNWCGLSMGGMVGMWLGANAPQRVNRLILSNTSAYFPDKEIWNGRIKTIKEKGLTAIAPGTMERWFTQDFRDHEPKKIAWVNETGAGIKFYRDLSDDAVASATLPLPSSQS